MSHFGVLVIGNDIEAQLQPYHEFECTGTNDQYVQDIDVTEECREHGLDYHGLEDTVVTNEATVDRAGEHKYGYAVVDTDGSLIKAINRTNPNKTWDWWVVGGRWSDWLKLKNGDSADSARKGDIDFDAMRAAAGARAAADWDKIRAALDTAAAPTTWTTWSHMRGVAHAGDIDAARNAYRNQPSVKAIEAVSGFSLRLDPDRYLASRADYIQQARDSSTVLYAVVMGGRWIAKGEMGWWGMSSDKVSEEEWCAQINSMLDALPDDTPITVVDCHI